MYELELDKKYYYVIRSINNLCSEITSNTTTVNDNNQNLCSYNLYVSNKIKKYLNNTIIKIVSFAAYPYPTVKLDPNNIIYTDDSYIIMKNNKILKVFLYFYDKKELSKFKLVM
ncbi:MAG: hypothetical protein [Caudoviricetes sp.]|nr:MAG: hypothetical protein [Caudoviricetes sp.]